MTASLRLAPGLGRPREKEALDEVDSGRSHELEVRPLLHPLRTCRGSDPPRVVDERLDERALVQIPVGTVDQMLVDLDHVGREVREVSQARIPGTGVVDGDPPAPASHERERVVHQL